MQFYSPSAGQMSLGSVFKDLMNHISRLPEDKYKIIIGTDSHAFHNESVFFVTAVIVHRVGKGGRYYFTKQKQHYMPSLRQRIYYETFLSLDVASRLTEKLAKNGHADLDIEIHLDVGEKGETREIIKEVVGMVIGSGYHARIKPDSYGATKVADRHTR